MALMSRTEVESITRRGVFHTRSNKLKAMLTALEHHRRLRTTLSFISLRQTARNWVQNHPKEYSKRHGDSFFNRLMTQLNWEEKFLQQVNRAKTLVQQLLTQRNQYIVNDADTSAANQNALQGSMQDQLRLAFQRAATPTGRLRPGNLAGRTTNNYWETLGGQVDANPTMGIRCAECSSLVVRELRQDAQMQLPIALIEQGDGHINGHFWVVVGYIVNDSPTYGVSDFGFDTFTIDLWGKSTFGVKLVTGPAGKIPMKMRKDKVTNQIKILTRWPATGTLGPPPPGSA
ncbi:MAG: hypothetical protein AB8G99_19965 [Planctomycetaceae bacterium]